MTANQSVRHSITSSKNSSAKGAIAKGSHKITPDISNFVTKQPGAVNSHFQSVDRFIH